MCPRAMEKALYWRPVGAEKTSEASALKATADETASTAIGQKVAKPISNLRKCWGGVWEEDAWGRMCGARAVKCRGMLGIGLGVC